MAKNINMLFVVMVSTHWRGPDVLLSTNQRHHSMMTGITQSCVNMCPKC